MQPVQLEFDFMRDAQRSNPATDPVQTLIVLTNLIGITDLCDAAERREARRRFRLAA